MSGNSGKMTNAALAARGPRMILARAAGGLFIYREYSPPMYQPHGVLAKSYSLSYLLRVAKANG